MGTRSENGVDFNEKHESSLGDSAISVKERAQLGGDGAADSESFERLLNATVAKTTELNGSLFISSNTIHRSCCRTFTIFIEQRRFTTAKTEFAPHLDTMRATGSALCEVGYGVTILTPKTAVRPTSCRLPPWTFSEFK